jgi:predicted regulator of Ras-like GTPase activity (Roadblock/LC7/MglB family)
VPRSAKNFFSTAANTGAPSTRGGRHARSMLLPADAAQALADLTEISSQVVQVAIVEGDGRVLATTIGDEARAERFVTGVRKLLDDAEEVRQARGLSGLVQLEAATLEGSIFIVRRGDRIVAASTRPDPTVGLVFYDLKYCLRSIEEPATPVAPARRTRRKAADASA